MTTIETPDRFASANADVKSALRSFIDGYRRRNVGIASNDDADFVAGNDELKSASKKLKQAYDEFPVDARPSPAV